MPRFILADLNPRYLPEIERQLTKPTPVAPAVSNAVPKYHVGPEPLDSHKAEERSHGRLEVRFERRSTRLLDKDNLYGGVKHCCDALRYAGLIKEDSPESIELIVTQTKVPTRKDCGTIIEIRPL